MKKIQYKVQIPFEIIVRGHSFIEVQPGVKIEDYLRAQVVLYSTRSLDNLDRVLEEEEIFGKEMLFSFNLSLENSIKKILEERCIRLGYFILEACTQIDKDLISGNKETIRSLNLILKSF